jgi:FkbM family methyltransferase
MVSTVEKIRIFMKAVKVFKNWNLFPVVYFKLTNKETVIFETKKGTKLKIRVKSTDLMALTNVWLVEEYANDKFEIKNNDTIVDIGGHIGLFSLYAAEKCKLGKIFTFEPVKENFELLTENIKINNIENIIPENIAVSTDESKVTIFLNDDQSGHGIHVKTSRSRIIDSKNLEEICLSNNINKCDFLKIDAEGSEFEICENIPENLLKKISKIVMEYHIFDKKSIEKLERIIEKFEKNNFEIIKKPHSDLLGLMYIRNKDHNFS